MSSRWGLRQKSQKRVDEEAIRRAVLIATYKRDSAEQPICRAARAGAPGRCGGPRDGHEIIPRSAWAKGYLVVDNVITVCRDHHHWIDTHPDEAHALGLHGYSWQIPKLFTIGVDDAD